jgi:DNA-binding MarR family transcriptional regulator
MSLKGNLSEFSLIQLLNLVNLARKSGALYLERPGETSRVIFREGKLVFAETGEEQVSLLKSLTDAKLISQAQNTILSERLKDLNEKAAGIYIISAGYADQEQILQVLQNRFSETMRKFFAWQEGSFRFESGELTPDGRIPVNMDLASLILEGARKLQEIEDLKAEIPSLDMALKFSDHPGSEIRDLNLNKEEWRVVNYINPKNTMQQIAKTLNMDDVEIRSVVYALLQAGLVEILRPEGAPPRLPEKMFPTKNPDEQKSLVNRLIKRIRSI